MSNDAKYTLADAIEKLPADCYDNPTARGLRWLARDVAVYAAIVGALIWTDRWYLLLPLWGLAALAISALFILGHDAAHGALFKSKRLNYLIGQAAMLPSLHLYEAWVFGHNRIHHGHTTRQDMDYVWHPVSPQEYDAYTPLGKLAHRIKWSCLGAGVYYGHEIWWNKMIHYEGNPKLRPLVRRDRLVVGTYAAAMTLALLAAGLAAYGSIAGAAWMWFKVFAAPFALWNYSIGFAVYVHHIDPAIRWHRRRAWTKFNGQVEGTTVLHVPAWMNFFYHNIFLHVPHHVDMRIPFYQLPRAVDALREHFSHVLVERRFTLSSYLNSTSNCKLFNFEAGHWQGYDGAPSAAVRSEAA